MGTGTLKLPRPVETELWPPEVDMILSAMEAACDPAELDRRYRHRMPYHVRGELRLYSDPPGAPAWAVYSRDVDPRGMGFITPHRLPLGYGGIIELFAPAGRKLQVPCTLFRCRQSVEGWYEGALYFNREQPAFDVEL